MKLRSILAGALALALSASFAFAQTNPGSSPLTPSKGGTNSAFVGFAGPGTSVKTFTLPNASETLAALGQIQTWTGAQSFGDGKLIVLGSSSGSSTIKAPATGGGTATLFPGSDTIAGLAATQALTNKTFNCASNTCTVRIASDVTGLGAGIATWLTTPSSANLAASVTDETGTLALVFANGPALTNPTVGTQSLLDNSTKAASTAYVDRTTREKLTGARTYFIRSDGSDSNTCLVDSAGGACATFAFVWSKITGTLDFGGQAVTIKIGGTTQTITNGFALGQPWTGGGTLTVDGGGGTISSAATCISNTVILPGSVTLQNVTLTSSGGGAVATVGSGTISIGTGVIFGAVNASFRHLDTQAAGARISATSPITITGGGQMHILATGGGEVMEQGIAITVTGRIVFGWYAYGDRLGFVNASANTWKGSATVTMTIATPAVVTFASHGLSIGDPIVFNTTGALPTGVTAGTTYFVIAAGFGAGAFQFSTTAGGAAVNTTGSQSGVHNAYSISGTRFNASGLANVFTNSAGINYFPGSAAGTGTNPSASPYGYYN